ncbi:hypothetical protein Tdes44962_MAKER01049 [Teratosphaeria destructans]|uniref:Uncharacterized protein n=1 Tax=Teratosphaeria destructans TaxID=418781 RepID=A0A9W7SIA3_9PEZI|nr:hypothetical protein Tdes44962_MAKER01049 [Teratosphaeria destructans]
MCPRRRRWHQQLARLKNPEIKGLWERAIPAALTVCSQFHDAVAEAFWRNRTVIIETFHHLELGQIAAANLRSLSLLEYVTNHPNTKSIGIPPSILMSMPFQKLERLELCIHALVPVYAFLDVTALLTEQGLTRARPAWWQREAAPELELITGTEELDRLATNYAHHLQSTRCFEHLLERFTAGSKGFDRSRFAELRQDLRASAWSLEDATELARCGRISSVDLRHHGAPGSDKRQSESSSEPKLQRLRIG